MNSPWIETTKDSYYPQLNENIEVHTCVIGGGITGISTAFLLLERGQKVVLLERNQIANGVSGYTSGHLTSLIDYQYHKIASTFSTETAKIVFESTVEARNLVERLIDEHHLTIGYEKVPGYYYATDEKQVKLLQKERKALQDIGIESIPVNSSEFPFKVVEAFKLDDQAVIDAAAYTRQMAKIFVEKGGLLFENSPVVDFTSEETHVEIKTQNFTVKAQKLVQATHTPIMRNPLQLELKNNNSYVIAGESTLEVKKGLFYDFADPYHYTRSYEKDGKAMFIVGGCDIKTGSDKDEGEGLRSLQQYAVNNWKVKQSDYKWSSMCFESSDGLPFIGKDPKNKNVFVATGFSGDGLTFGLVSAILNAELVFSDKHPWESTFNPKRIKLKSMGDVAKKGVDMIKHSIIDRLKRNKGEKESITEGEGKIVTIEGERVGIYLDEDSNIHVINPVCPHMNCILNWNMIAKTWDCGCHGSRFDPDGKIISGPSVHDLEKIKF